MGLQEGPPPGKVDRRPHRSLPDRRPRPRPYLESGNGVRQGQQDPRPAGENPRQSRRLHVAVLVVGADLSLRHAAVGPVQHPGDLCRGDDGLYQHHAGRRLSRRRPSRSELSGRAADGNRSPAVEGRPGGIAPQELHHPVPAPDARDHGLRHRRFRRLAGCVDEGDRLCRLPRAQGESQSRRQAARHRRLLLHRGLRHRALESGRQLRAPASACGSRPKSASIRWVRSKS